MALFVHGASSEVFAGDRPAELIDLLARAETLDVAHEREWQNLLHYGDRRFLPGRRSGTRDPRFFLAADGWKDPEAELRATLLAFFLDPATVPEDEQHPQCRFPARRAWLLERLGADESWLPEAHCQRFLDWYEGINPHEITLVFAAAYLGNPASMFGHTLLRVDPPGQARDSRLLSYVINHAASTDETSGFVFAFRGLTGGYPGLFSIMPYYEKVREYNSLESRDLWEYRLNLKPDEVEQLLRHTWELRGVGFPYYFLYQNCSYRLLELLDVARPGMDLAERFSWWAIPTDTIRAVLAENDMLREVVYRPAERVRLNHQVGMLSPSFLDKTLALAEGNRHPDELDAGLNAADRALVLETAYDYLNFLQRSGQANGDLRDRMRELLVSRSRITGVGRADVPNAPETRPDQGHGTLRLGLGGGRRGDHSFVSLHWRPAYHDGLDPPSGYIPGAYISYGELELRYDEHRDRMELERLMLVDIESLNPRDRLFRSWSWHIRAGGEQRLRPTGGRSLMGGVNGGGGGTWQVGDSPLWIHTGLQAGIWGSRHLDHDARALVGPRIDLRWHGRGFPAHLGAEGFWSTDASGPGWRIGYEQSVIISANLSVRAGVFREQDFGVHQTSVQSVIHGYF